MKHENSRETRLRKQHIRQAEAKGAAYMLHMDKKLGRKACVSPYAKRISVGRGQ